MMTTIEDIKTSCTNISDTSIEDSIISLQVISSIPKNGRLFVRSNKINVENFSNFQALIRWYWGDSRDKALDYIKNILDKIENIILQKNSELNTLIYTKLENSIIGLNNLKETYCRDILTQERINFYIHRIQFLANMIRGESGK